MSSAGSPSCWTRARTLWYACSTVATGRKRCRGRSPPSSNRFSCRINRIAMLRRSKASPMAL
eukprot:2231284-Lingulodinium_polyedra.AAC.1